MARHARPTHRRRTRRRSMLAAVTMLTGAVAGVTGTAGPASAVDTWQVPASARIVISGHGYGHGHGMSQYGAAGAAREGLGYRKIVEFYYPDTEWGIATGKVSVLVSSDTTDDLVVLDRPGLSVRDLATGTRSALPDVGATRWRLLAGVDGTTVVSYLSGTWRRWGVLEGDGEFYAKGEPVSLVTPSGVRAYRGRLRSASPTPGPTARDTVNVLSLDNYLRGVVPLEMPASWSPAAVRAQSVAARTYAAYEREHPRADHYQICDTTACQVYGGADAEHPDSDAAIVATAQRVLLADGEPAFTQFSSSSGGWTAAGAAPYLAAQEDPYDGWSGNPVHSWSVTFTDADIEARYPAIGNLQRVIVAARDGNGDWGGRVVSVTFVGAKDRVTVSGDSARATLGLRSTWFTFRVRSAA